MEWASEVESRIASETELELRRRELEWLQENGNLLASTCLDQNERTLLEDKLHFVLETWQRLRQLARNRTNKQQEIQQV